MRVSYVEEVVFQHETAIDIWHEILFEGILGSVPQLGLELWYLLFIVQTGLDWFQVVGFVVSAVQVFGIIGLGCEVI